MLDEARIVVVDDEEAALRGAELVLYSNNCRTVHTFADGHTALDHLAAHGADLVIADLCMPHLDGEELLERIGVAHPEIPVLMLTAVNELEQAVRCMRAGAVDYLVKPVDEMRLVTSVRNALHRCAIERENSQLRAHLIDRSLRRPELFADMLTNSPAMHAVFAYVEAIAPGSQPVLITGETGTGKELIARALHAASDRPGDFVAVNVAGIDEGVLADTLFGHTRGAFTGADRDRPGLIERAAGGTLFLDEIGDLTAGSQVKLLRLLQEREYYPVGSDHPRQSDARVLTATMRDLDELVSADRFRRDLYYRLRQHRVHLPPLRERREDLALLIPRFVEQAAYDLGQEPPFIPPEIVDLLGAAPLPGNVRELQALIAEAVARHQGGVLSLNVLRRAVRDEPATHPDALDPAQALRACPSLPPLKEVRQLLVQEALTRSNGNQSVAATLLGVTRQAIARYLHDS